MRDSADQYSGSRVRRTEKYVSLSIRMQVICKRTVLWNVPTDDKFEIDAYEI